MRGVPTQFVRPAWARRYERPASGFATYPAPLPTLPHTLDSNSRLVMISANRCYARDSRDGIWKNPADPPCQDQWRLRQQERRDMTLPAATLDHVVINARDDMDRAADIYRRLGFTLTERGYHSLGSTNH